MIYRGYRDFGHIMRGTLSGILEEAKDSEITSVIGKPIRQKRRISNESREQKYDCYAFSYIFFKNDLNLCLDVGVVAYGNEQCDELITEFDIRCYFRVPKRQQFEWLDSFRKHNNFFTDEANFYVDESLGSEIEDDIIERSDDFIEIGLYRRITLEEELKACLEELKACLDGRSSRTVREIKQRMFNCFFTVNGEMFGADEDPDNHPFEFQFESILNEFLTCIKNHKSC